MNSEIIEVDEFSDSGYYTDSSLDSVASSIRQYFCENGRRYHIYWGGDKALLPTDELEHERLDASHEGYRLLYGGALHKAPIENPKKVLDLGCGTGIWAIEFADLNPQTEVIGVDINPQNIWAPPNCTFETDDIEREWTFSSDAFDFIHARNIFQSVTNWPALLSQIHKCLKPGGYVEIVELEPTITSDDQSHISERGMTTFFEHFNRAMSAIGRPSDNPAAMAGRLSEAGFLNPVVTKTKQPIGPWPKDKLLKQAGALGMLEAHSRGFEAYGLAAFTRILGMPPREAMKLCEDAKNSYLDACRTMHAYGYLVSIYAQKAGPGGCSTAS